MQEQRGPETMFNILQSLLTAVRHRLARRKEDAKGNKNKPPSTRKRCYSYAVKAGFAVVSGTGQTPLRAAKQTPLFH